MEYWNKLCTPLELSYTYLAINIKYISIPVPPSLSIDQANHQVELFYKVVYTTVTFGSMLHQKHCTICLLYYPITIKKVCSMFWLVCNPLTVCGSHSLPSTEPIFTSITQSLHYTGLLNLRWFIAEVIQAIHRVTRNQIMRTSASTQLPVSDTGRPNRLWHITLTGY